MVFVFVITIIPSLCYKSVFVPCLRYSCSSNKVTKFLHPLHCWLHYNPWLHSKHSLNSFPPMPQCFSCRSISHNRQAPQELLVLCRKALHHTSCLQSVLRSCRVVNSRSTVLVSAYAFMLRTDSNSRKKDKEFWKKIAIHTYFLVIAFIIDSQR